MEFLIGIQARPGCAMLGDWRSRPSGRSSYDLYEPVDSPPRQSAAQGLLRLGRYLNKGPDRQAGLTIANTSLRSRISVPTQTSGLIRHAVYHRPNDWDAVPKREEVPADESCMWGDYHALELGLYLLRRSENKTGSELLE